MRYRLAGLTLLVAIILTGCGKADSAPERIREYYAAQNEVNLSATLRTDFGDRVLDFTVDYTRYADGNGHIKVMTPEIIAGIEADIAQDGISLAYDGLIMELGPLPGTGLSPMESLPFIIKQWGSGYVTQTGGEKRAGRDLITVEHRLTQGETAISVMTWFDGETMRPVTSELSVNGFLTVTAFFVS